MIWNLLLQLFLDSYNGETSRIALFPHLDCISVLQVEGHNEFWKSWTNVLHTFRHRDHLVLQGDGDTPRCQKMFRKIQFSLSSCYEGRSYLCRCSSGFLSSLVDSFQPQWEFFDCITDEWEIMTCTAVHRFWSLKHFSVVSSHKKLSLWVCFRLWSQ